MPKLMVNSLLCKLARASTSKPIGDFSETFIFRLIFPLDILCSYES
jgi:hypothetical protein